MIEKIAEAIYEAKKENAWGNWKSQYRGKWPKDKKEMRTRLHHGDVCLEFAFVQAKAALEAMKKPTRAMKNAANAIYDADEIPDYYAAYIEMIDQALKDGE